MVIGGLASHPVVQGTLAALSTFVLEDPTTVGAGLLVAAQQMSFTTAMVGVSAGIAIGDLGLYGLGRLAGPKVSRWGMVSRARLERARRWYGRNLVAAVLLSRFVPGLRLPTYVGAGVARAPLLRFLAVAVAASVVWTWLLLKLTVLLGEAVLPLLGRARWPVAATALAALVVLQRRTGRDARGRGGETAPAALSSFERWPPWLFYAPVVAWWLWLAVRHRGLLLPTAANPSIYSGGFLGESKRAILDLVPEPHRRWLAHYTALERGADPGSTLAESLAAMAREGLGFPLVAKPDVGQRGAGVRLLEDEQDLRSYLKAFPEGAALILQELAVDTRSLPPPVGATPEQAHEAGVLYWRLPGHARGTVPSLTLKIFPEVAGDGLRTVAELLDADPRASELRELYTARLGRESGRVPADGERVPLVFAGNHCQGAVFLDGREFITPELVDRFDEIARAMPELWFGRFDVRFERLDDLARGEGFRIVEINGASAESTHIWDARATLPGAYRALFRQFDVLFRIGAANRRRGHRPLPLGQLLRDVAGYRRLAAGYPPTD